MKILTVSDYVEPILYDRFDAEHFPDVDLILIGMGSPKSERVATIAAEECPRAVVWHIGGGTIRFLAGTVREAPTLMRRMGLQWLHRLLVEPRRMWRRYLVGNWVFLFSVFTARLSRKRTRAD